MEVPGRFKLSTSGGNFAMRVGQELGRFFRPAEKLTVYYQNGEKLVTRWGITRGGTQYPPAPILSLSLQTVSVTGRERWGWGVMFSCFLHIHPSEALLNSSMYKVPNEALLNSSM